MGVTLDYEIESRVNHDLAARAHSGIWGHLVSLSVVSLTTTELTEHPLVMAGFAILFGAHTVARAYLAGKVARLERSELLIWRLWFHLVLLASGALWGLLAAWTILTYGFAQPNGCLVMLYHAAVAVVGVEVFVHNRRLGFWYLACTYLAPLLLLAALPASQRWGPFWAFSLFAFFLSRRLMKLSTAYDERLSEHCDLALIADTDPLTGLRNRLAMRRNMKEELVRAGHEGHRAALLFIDLDEFKAINDTLSHRIGDLFLREIAARLVRCAGTDQAVSRLGGDEFTILISQPAVSGSDDAIWQFAEKVQTAICEPVMIDDYQCASAASIGVSVFPDLAANAEDLVRTADHAMYDAKRAGKGRICLAPGPLETLGNHPAVRVLRSVSPNHHAML